MLTGTDVVLTDKKKILMPSVKGKEKCLIADCLDVILKNNREETNSCSMSCIKRIIINQIPGQTKEKVYFFLRTQLIEPVCVGIKYC